jgi:hypothetical protein
MQFNELNEDNFLLFAIKNYENPQAITKEDFEKDLNHFRYIKRLLKKYKKTGVLKVHLILNHFLIIYNIFGEAATAMILYKLDYELWEIAKSFIIFLNKLPEYPISHLHSIKEDESCKQILLGITDDTLR